MNQNYQFQSHSGSSASESSLLVHAVSSIFSNSFGINPKTQQPYRLGPKTTKKRLALAHQLFLASDEADHPVGYLFGTEIPSSCGSVGWIDSLAVLPQHRRKGIGTRLVANFAEHFSSVRWIGCATPNPIAALVISKVIKGTLFIGECDPTEELLGMINDIRPLCQDLRGVDFNPDSLLVRTQFHPPDTGDNKEWCPPHPTEPPPWWSSLENLSSQYEALLIVDKSHEN